MSGRSVDMATRGGECVADGRTPKWSTLAETITWLDILAGLPIVLDDETASRDWSNTLTLARSHRLSAYDAAYLELAMRRDLPLATLDRSLMSMAKSTGVRLFQNG